MTLTRFCKRPGCMVRIPASSERYCEAHKQESWQRYDKHRESSSKRGYNSRWYKARTTYLLSNPLCVICKEQGMLMAASVVDHRIPHKGDQALFWDTNNWQALCARCHNTKTATHDGGFGNKVSGTKPDVMIVDEFIHRFTALKD